MYLHSHSWLLVLASFFPLFRIVMCTHSGSYFHFIFSRLFWYVFFLFSGSWFLVRNSRFLVPSASSKRKHPFHVIRLTRPLGRPPPCRGSVTWALFVSVLVPVLFMAAFVLLSNFLKPEFACGYAVSAYVFLIFFITARKLYAALLGFYGNPH